MWEHLLKIAFVSLYVAILLTVAFYGFHRYVLVYLYIKHRNNVYQPKGTFDDLPRVTVQLPMYNEDLVAERIIKRDLPDRLSARQARDPGARRQHRPLRRHRPQAACRGDGPPRAIRSSTSTATTASATRPARWPRA